MTTVPDSEARIAGPNPWLVLVCLGVLTAVVGIWIMVSGEAKIATVAILLAVGLFLNALSEFVWASTREHPGVGYLIGGLLLLGGIIVLFQPGSGARALAIVVGVVLVTIGLLQSVVALMGRRDLHHWAALLVFGLLTMAVGVAAIIWPDVTVKVLGFLVGLRLLIVGIGMTGLGLDFRRLAH